MLAKSARLGFVGGALTGVATCRPNAGNGVVRLSRRTMARNVIRVLLKHTGIGLTGVVRILVWGRPPGRRYPAMHQLCTRLKMSRAAGGLGALGALQQSAESRVELESEIEIAVKRYVK